MFVTQLYDSLVGPHNIPRMPQEVKIVEIRGHGVALWWHEVGRGGGGQRKETRLEGDHGQIKVKKPMG